MVPAEQAINRRSDGTFAPGSSGNPNGRPKGSVSLSSVLKRRLLEVSADEQSTVAELLVDSTIEAALAGDAQARRLVWVYADGRPLLQEPMPEEREDDPIAEAALHDPVARELVDDLLFRVQSEESQALVEAGRKRVR